MKYKLGELFDLQMGKTPDRHISEFWAEGSKSWISIADLSKCGKYIEYTTEQISEKAVKKSGIKLIPENTVIMSFKLSIGKVAITSKEMYSNEAIMAFINKGVIQIEPAYLYYLLMQKDWDAGTNKAVMGKTLNKATLSQIPVNIHEPIDQLEIISVLDKISAVIEVRKQQLTELDNLIKARFVEMFANYPDVEKLSNVANVSGGLTKSSKRDKMPLRMPYLRVANVAFATIDTTEMLDIGLTEEEREKTLLKDDDLLFVEGNGSPDQIGRVAVWHDEIIPCVHQNHLIKARFDRTTVLPVVAMYYFMSQKGTTLTLGYRCLRL